VKRLYLGVILGLLVISVTGVTLVYATPIAKLVICKDDPAICPNSNATIALPITGVVATLHYGDCTDNGILIYQLSNHTWICGHAPVNRTPVAASTPTTTGTSSLVSQVMGGVGNVCTYTPIASGRVYVALTMDGQSSKATGGGIVQIRYGNGTAPINGVAATGFTLGSIKQMSGSSPVPISLSFFGSGLTLHTPYWFDFGQEAVGSGVITFTNIDCTIIEL
jgi:hypothetical protein